MTNSYLNQTAEQLLATMAKYGPQSPEAIEAFNAFYSLHRRRFNGICLKICWEYKVPQYKEVAKDISQNVLIKILYKANLFDSTKSSAFTWISRIVVNEVLSHFRQRKKLKCVSLETEDLQLQTAIEKAQEGSIPLAHDGASDAIKNPYLTKVDDALSSLSVVQEDIIRTTLLYAPNDMPGTERKRIANRYGIAEASIDVYRTRAKQSLEAKMGVPIDWKSLKENVGKRTDAE